MRQFTQSRNSILQELDAKATEEGFILNISQTGLMIFPGKEGKPLGEDGSLVMEHPLADPDWAVRHVLQYGPDATVLDPPEIREAICRRLEAMKP